MQKAWPTIQTHRFLRISLRIQKSLIGLGSYSRPSSFICSDPFDINQSLNRLLYYNYEIHVIVYFFWLLSPVHARVTDIAWEAKSSKNGPCSFFQMCSPLLEELVLDLI